MVKAPKVSSRFRKKLRDELALWLSEGFVTAEQARALRERYTLSDLGREGTGLLLAMIYTIGAVLIGGGAISFVAAHWEWIPKPGKVALLSAAMLTAHVIGYVLWRVKGTRPRLGHALVLLGTLIFGANIGLMAQIFHIRSHFYTGFAAWAAGAAVISYCLWSIPHALVAIVASFIWCCGWAADHVGEFTWYPVVLLAAGLPLAYLRRSGLTFFLLLVAFAAATPIDVGVASEALAATVLAGVGVALLLSGYGAFHLAVRPRPEVGPTALALGGLSLAIWSYVLSFRWAAEELTWEGGWWRGDVASSAFVVATFCAGLVFWKLSGRRALKEPAFRPYVVALWVGVLLVAVASGPPLPGIPAVILSNTALVGLAVGLVWSGLVSMRRRVFWCGVALMALLILSRFLEYETSLMLKSVVFLALGVGVLYGGIKFEAVLRRKGMVDE
jgi:uncharacterized membrane protein